MKRILKFFTLVSLLVLLLTACGQKELAVDYMTGNNGPLKIVTSFTILQDIAKEIGGDHVEVHNLVPTGTDPHEYEPLPEDIKKVTDAQILFYNGLNLEGGQDGWFFKMVESVGQREENVFSLTERVEPMYLSSDDGTQEVNPHSFIAPSVGIKMAEDIRDILVKKDPANKDDYQQRATEYINQLKDIDRNYAAKINEIPMENRILVTSERAFQYMAKDYGLKEGYIWAIDTEVDTYIKYLNYNINLIYNELK